MFAHQNKKVKLTLTALVTLSMSTPLAYAQSPYVQTYGKQSNAQRAKAAAKQIQKSGKATKGSAKAGKTATAKTGTAKKKKLIMIVKPKQHISAGPKWQQFSSFINLKPGQEKLPLKFTILNGSGGTPPLRAIRATLSGRKMFTEKDFKGKRKLSIDLSNALSSGSTQIIFQAYGAAGSAFKWQVTSSVRPVVLSISPEKGEREAEITAKGKNLPVDLRLYKVTVEDKLAKVTAATNTNFKFKIPKKVKPGKDKKVVIKIAGMKMKDFKISIQQAPEITWFSQISLAGAQTLIIKGKHFSKDSKDVEVTFNKIKGFVQGSGDNFISVTVPDIKRIPAIVSVNVKVNGLDCKKPGKLLFSMRNIPNENNYSPFEIPPQLK